MCAISRRNVLINLGLLASPLVSLEKSISSNKNENLRSDFPNMLSGKMITITDFMTPEEIVDVNSKKPMLDHSSALKKALSVSKTVFIPAVNGYYRIKDVELEDGVWLVGSSKLPYSPKNIQDILGCGSAIVMENGGGGIFKFNNNVTLFGILMYGNSKRNADGIEISNRINGGKISNLRFMYCGFYSFRVGVGNDFKYIKADVINCAVAGNLIGIKNTVDSKISGTTINANQHDGIYLGKGANDNIIIDVKCEWNKGNNFNFYQCINNILSNSISDRAGFTGIRVVKAQVIVDSCVLRRNSSIINDAEDSTHIWIEGEGSSFLGRNIKTAIGKNDNRSGILSPSYAVIFAGKSNLFTVIISDSDLSGAKLLSFNKKIEPQFLKLNSNIIKK